MLAKMLMTLCLAATSGVANGHSSYIVLFADGASEDTRAEVMAGVEAAGGRIEHKYSTLFKGFAGPIPDAHVSSLRSQKAVSSIEKDGTVRAAPVGDGHVHAF
jgi:hypothetical protein